MSAMEESLWTTCQLCLVLSAKQYNAHATNTSPVPFKTLDLLIEGFRCIGLSDPTSSRKLHQGLYACRYDCVEEPLAALIEESESPILSFVTNVLERHAAKPKAKSTAVKLMVALCEGWLVRTDILKQRLMGCRSVGLVAGFLNTDQQTVPYQSIRDAPDLLKASVRYACGGILLNDTPNASPESLLEELQASLVQRMSFPWILPKTIPCKRLAVVGGRHISTMAKYTESANALNIKLVVLGPPGHWLENSCEVTHREAFLPIDMTIDEGLPQRVVDALSGYPAKLDGITTFTDWLLTSTARAAEMLGLTSAPVDSFHRSTDKHTTRIMDLPKDFQVFRITNMDDLEQHLPALSYPVVVKPCRGWNSDGVLKATSELELRDAIQYLAHIRNPHDIIVETYVSGPEVDANFALADGEILLFELVDDFPSAADIAPSSATSLDPSTNFLETSMLYPSALPLSEHDLIRTSLHAKLLALGFRTGVFHLEARVVNSSMQYTLIPEINLRPLPTSRLLSPTKPPSTFLLEINARAPGIPAIWSTLLTSGIDYSAIHLLSALPLSCSSTAERLKILCTPFPEELRNNIHCNLVFIPVTRGGIFGNDDVCDELGARRPDLVSKVALSYCCFKKGMRVPDPSEGTLAFAAYFCVLAKERNEAVRLGEEIRREVKIVIK
ncbi:hypothetical protein AOQ84DRAFT_402714 [Glonium stellatum]|uniref:ATP-grasp domain-containing protein n=1 Tax=Glonium stellatum TaxID=574774 RepID=A0A8E2F423_9PEZI|nr:hypothetical protein AOQ84DRAFT_402714 [Glonium stellatum]